ncbi:MAG: SDR family NAD(P)-dependent oxidoreductase [Pseudomonadales bacterium]|jgi:dehydrogenase/reductase SDR family protein 12|nr:SDR family NAD(P)-dependent oxidoreductase [Pseudomonadales bacterium]
MNPLQRAINATRFFSGFLPSFSALGHRARAITWAPLEPDFRGQRWLVTGASTGLGREIARRAAVAGAEVLAVARSGDRLASLAEDVRGGAGTISAFTADLALVSEVDRLADHLTRAQAPLDVLVNNVGVLLARPETTAEGLDLAFATNLLGPWHLTERLRGERGLSPGGAVITMSSGGLYNVRLSLRALENQAHYQGALAYAAHKRAQLAVNHQWRADARGIDYYVMHPGWADTPGVATSLPAFHRLLGPLLRTAAEGCDTALWLAATRPRQRTDPGLWFDRALRSEHLLLGTRGGADEGALLAYLAEALERARGSAQRCAAAATH